MASADLVNPSNPTSPESIGVDPLETFEPQPDAQVSKLLKT